MADVSLQLMEALQDLEAVTDVVSPDAAFDQLDETTLQLFWRDWPHISSWAGALWRRLDRELAEMASPADAGLADVGGSG